MVKLPDDPVKAARLRRSLRMKNLALYARDVLTGPKEAPYNGRFIIGDHHKEWAAALTKHNRIAIEASRDHGKSQFWTVAFSIWMAERFPREGERGYIFSASQEQAADQLEKVREEIETNPKLHHLLPHGKQRGKWGRRAIKTHQGHTIVAKGYGTRVRGGHPRWAVIDDPMNDNTAYSELVRRREIEYFYKTIRPMVVPGGYLIVVGTPQHQADLLADLHKNPAYFSMKYPAIYPKDHPKAGQPLWPARYSLADLEFIKLEMGNPHRFAREYLCNPVADINSLFPSYLFEGKKVVQPRVRLGMPYEFWKSAGIDTVFIGVDLGLTANIGSDYTIIFVVGLDKNGNRWILDIRRSNQWEYERQKREIVKAAGEYHADLIFVESNLAQRIYGTTLQSETDLPIKLFDMSEAKHHAVKGVPAIRTMLENKKYRIPYDFRDARTAELITEWIGEMQALTVDEAGRVITMADHDDLPMATYICEQAIREGGFSASFGPEPDDVEAFSELLAEYKEDESALEDLQEDGLVPMLSVQADGKPWAGNLRIITPEEAESYGQLPSMGLALTRPLAELGKHSDGTLTQRAITEAALRGDIRGVGPGGQLFGAPPASWFLG